MQTPSVNTHSADDCDTLSAIWILSCVDKDAIMTYIGLSDRLRLSQDHVQQLVRDHVEMFREGFPGEDMTEWRAHKLKKPPGWLRKEDTSRRVEALNAVQSEHVFRNQFRPTSDSPRLEIEVISWGLEHIERLRKAGAESREELRKHAAEFREERFRLRTGILVPLFSSCVALAAVLSGAYLQVRTMNEQRDLKHYEVGLKPRQEGYSSFMQSIMVAYGDASRKDSEAFKASLSKMEVAYYNIESLLVGDWRKRILDEYQQFSDTCNKIRDQSAGTPEYQALAVSLRKQMDSLHSDLYQALFDSQPSGS